MNRAKWDARTRRAEDLAASHPFASEGLLFYCSVANAQKQLYARIEAARGTEIEVLPEERTFRSELDLSLLLPLFPFFLSRIEQNAPAPLSEGARRLCSESAVRWQDLLSGFWLDPDDPVGLDAVEGLIAWTFLQPYAEYLADHARKDPLHATPSQCPLCGTKPQVGVLRPEGDGAKRSLICGLCGHEWDYRRIVCPFCAEENPHKLAIYTAEPFDHVRVETCDSCRRYIKTVDLSKNGRAVPVVDDLATIPLNLWAADHGYRKLRTNLLGI